MLHAEGKYFEIDFCAMKCCESVSVAGCNFARVASDEDYVSLFRCGLCACLVSLDSVVSECCSQPFCAKCHEEYQIDLARKLRQSTCSRCQDGLEVKTLQSSQPLSFKVLTSIQNACGQDECSWYGRYDKFAGHVRVHESMQLDGTNEPSPRVEVDNEPEGNEKTNIELQCTDEEQKISERDYLYNKADKLKKQANGKSNSGDLQKARKLYTQGINMLKDVPPLSDSDLKLLSDMHANRAYTFFQKKNFDECIEDCEYAIEYEPSLEKSWLRKWRALMAKGDFEEAHKFLRQASLEIPESSRIQQAYAQSKAEMETYTTIESTAEGESPEYLVQVVRDHCNSTENVALLTQFAKVFIAQGNSESALKTVEIALGINPHYADCIELRGLCHFFAGNLEKGVRALSEGCKLDHGNEKLERTLAKVQETSATYEKARAEMKRCRYAEANLLFTKAIELSEPVPSKSVLFSKLRADNAKCLLHMMEYPSALKLCHDITDVQGENALAWVIRSEVLMATGKEEEARKELHLIRRTWGANDLAIQLAYRRVDFERSVFRVNMDVLRLQENLDKRTKNEDLAFFTNKEEIENNAEGVVRNVKISRSENQRTRQRESANGQESRLEKAENSGKLNAVAKQRRMKSGIVNAGQSDGFRMVMYSKSLNT